MITLREPPKDELTTYLELEHKGDQGTRRPKRCVRVEVIIKGGKRENDLLELIVDLDNGSISEQKHLKGKHSYIDSAYMKEVEEACLANPKIQKEIEILDLPSEGSVVVEPWAYATDGSNDMSRRTTMVGLNIVSLF